MLKGFFDPTAGRPFIAGHLLLPGPDQRLFEVVFLVDTGSDDSFIMPRDARRLSIDTDTLGAATRATGAGGEFRQYTQPAVLTFAEPGVGVHLYQVLLSISADRQDLVGAPSLLGRDVLDRWCMTYDPTNDRLDFEVRSSDRVIPRA